MSVLNSSQTTKAVRALIYFGAHEFNGEIDLGDCRAKITSQVSVKETPVPYEHDEDTNPLYEEIVVKFNEVQLQGRQLDGSITVRTVVRWPNLSERLKDGSSAFQIAVQPVVKHQNLTRSCLVAFGRLIEVQEKQSNFAVGRAEREAAIR